MPPIFHQYFEQRSAEWHRARLGIPTASEMHKIVTPKKCEPSTQADAYMNRLLAEWVLGEPIADDEPYQSYWMERGSELEEAAVRAFEFQTNLSTSPVGFVTTIDGLVGASPDRLVEGNGTLELKCPAAHTHIGYLRSESPEEKTSICEDYRVQVQAQMWICEREKSWVSSYHPKLPAVIIEIPRDEKYIARLKVHVLHFVEKMLKHREALEKRYGPFVRPERRGRAPKEVIENFGELVL